MSLRHVWRLMASGCQEEKRTLSKSKIAEEEQWALKQTCEEEHRKPFDEYSV